MKRVLLLLAVTVAIISCSTPKGTAGGYRGKYPNRAAAIAAQIHDPQSKYVIVVCHRGDWRNFPENSIPVIESVIKMGAGICLQSLGVFLKKPDYYMDQQRPISIKEMPYTIDLRALLAYAKARGVAVFDLSEEEKQRFLIPNSQYQAELSHSVDFS